MRFKHKHYTIKPTKVIVRGIPHKEFVGRYGSSYGEDIGGLTSKENHKWTVRIDANMNMKTAKRILLHELGHVFSAKQHIARRLPNSEKRALVSRFGNTVADSTYTTRGKVQEVIAEVSRVNDQRKYKTLNKQIKKVAPKTWSIIQAEEKKFKPRVVWTGMRKKGLNVRFS